MPVVMGMVIGFLAVFAIVVWRIINKPTVVDFLIALSLDLPRAAYDTVAMTVFDLITGVIARWLYRQLGRGETTATVISAFSGVLFVHCENTTLALLLFAPR